MRSLACLGADCLGLVGRRRDLVCQHGHTRGQMDKLDFTDRKLLHGLGLLASQG
jgi:hypothetical protein